MLKKGKNGPTNFGKAQFLILREQNRINLMIIALHPYSRFCSPPNRE